MAECECGQEKLPNTLACVRCDFLDSPGRPKHSTAGSSKGRIISALRVLGTSTNLQVAEYLQLQKETATRTLASLRRAGRVRKVDPYADRRPRDEFLYMLVSTTGSQERIFE